MILWAEALNLSRKKKMHLFDTILQKIIHTKKNINNTHKTNNRKGFASALMLNGETLSAGFQAIMGNCRHKKSVSFSLNRKF